MKQYVSILHQLDELVSTSKEPRATMSQSVLTFRLYINSEYKMQNGVNSRCTYDITN